MMPPAVKRAGPWLVVGLLPLLLTWRVFLRDETFFLGDIASQYFPREYLLSHQGLVGWSPHTFLGMSLASDPQTAPYEPIRALARAVGLGQVRGLALYLLFYFAVGGAGFFLLARRRGASLWGAVLALLAGLWAGPFLLRIRHPWMLGALCLLPWVAWASDRLLERRGVREALVLALFMAWGALAGHPQTIYIAWLYVLADTLGALWFAERGARRAQLNTLGPLVALAAIAFVALSAASYWPSVLALGESARSGEGIVSSAAYSLAPRDLLRLLVPFVDGSDVGATYGGATYFCERTLYLGLAPLLLAALALGIAEIRRAERRLLVIGALGLGLALGKYFVFYFAAYFLLPGFRLFRSPNRYGFLFLLAAALLAGRMLTAIAEDRRPQSAVRLAMRFRWLWASAALFVTLVAIAPRLAGSQVLPGGVGALRIEEARAAVLLVGAGWIIDRWLRGRLRGRWSAALLLALTAIVLLLTWGPYKQTTARKRLSPPAAVTAALASSGRLFPFSWDTEEVADYLNRGEVTGYENLRGYNQAIAADILRLFKRADLGREKPLGHYVLGPFVPADWLLNLGGVRRLLAPPGDWPEDWRRLPLVGRTDRLEVREYPSALPRAWLVGRVEVASRAEALERLPTIDPRQVALVEHPLELGGGMPGEAKVVGRGYDEVTVETEARAPALLVLAERMENGWRATLDGQPVEIVRTDYLLRGVAVPAGRHVVRFDFTPPGVRTGRAVSLVALALVLGALLLRRERKG